MKVYASMSVLAARLPVTALPMVSGVPVNGVGGTLPAGWTLKP